VREEDWPNMKVRDHNVRQNRTKLDGRIMFPTTHDITPEVALPCMIVMEKMLQAGNELLVVSKPHPRVIEMICLWFQDYRDKITFRFTIGSVDDEILSYWEPGAPKFTDRLLSLHKASDAGFNTSVSSEPLLDAENVDILGTMILPWINDAWWIGKMNKVEQRVRIETEKDREMVDRIKAGQTNEAIRAIYERFKDDPKVKWKESIKEIVGLDLPKEVGEDM
jgi:hypothetical protein